MKLLIVAATHAEIDPLLTYFDFDGSSLKVPNHVVDVLITDVGMVATAFAMGQQLAREQYDLAINLGIAGSFDRDLAMGDVVVVNQDIFADWGAEDDEAFLSIDALGFGESVQFATNPLVLKGIHLKKVTGITVNKVHGNETSIAKTIARLNPQIESMEGAAFFYACNQMSMECIQIRSISNYVERRDREKWDIHLAIKNMNELVINFLNTLVI